MSLKGKAIHRLSICDINLASTPLRFCASELMGQSVHHVCPTPRKRRRVKVQTRYFGGYPFFSYLPSFDGSCKIPFDFDWADTAPQRPASNLVQISNSDRKHQTRNTIYIRLQKLCAFDSAQHKRAADYYSLGRLHLVRYVMYKIRRA